MPEPLYEDIVQLVFAKGYNAGKLVRTKQSE